MGILILLLVSDIMTQDKKPKKNDIEKLRMVLDSPSDPKVRKIVAKHEKNLESIRERLSGEPSKTKMKYTTSDLLKKSDSLEPRVVIHEKEEEVAPSEIESHIPEQQKEESKDDDADLQDLFDAEDLYEVEKVDVSEPEFLEVKPKEMGKVFEKTPAETEEPLPTPIQEEKEPTKEMHEKEEELPEWEHVEETKPKEMEKVFEKTPAETEEPLPAPIQEEKEPTKEVHEKEEELPEWEPVEETKPKEIEELVEEKEEQTPKEFLEVTTVDEKTMPQDSAGETEEEIPTWEPIGLEETQAEKEISSEVIEEKPADETLGKVSEQKEVEPEITVKETKAELKRKEKELKKRRKEEEKQKKLEAKKEKKHIGEIGAREKQEKEILSRSERKKQKRKAKKAEKEKEAQIKAKLKKAESKIPKLEADEDLSFEEKIVEDKPTEWESYDMDEMPEEKPDDSVYTHGDFTLYKKEIKTATGKKRTVHFFSKKTPDMGDAVQLPEGYEVKVNRRTNLPYLKKKK